MGLATFAFTRAIFCLSHFSNRALSAVLEHHGLGGVLLAFYIAELSFLHVTSAIYFALSYSNVSMFVCRITAFPLCFLLSTDRRHLNREHPVYDLGVSPQTHRFGQPPPHCSDYYYHHYRYCLSILLLVLLFLQWCDIFVPSFTLPAHTTASPQAKVSRREPTRQSHRWTG